MVGLFQGAADAAPSWDWSDVFSFASLVGRNVELAAQTKVASINDYVVVVGTFCFLNLIVVA